MLLVERKKAASLGVRFGSDGNGYRYAELPKDYHKSIYSFGKAVKELKILEIL